MFLTSENIPNSKISESNHIKLPPGLPRTDIVSPQVASLNKANAILLKHQRLYLDAVRQSTVCVSKFTKLADSWAALGTSCDTIHKNITDGINNQKQCLEHSLFPYIEELMQDMRATPKDKKSKFILDFYDSHLKEKIDAMLKIEKRSLSLLESIGIALENDDDMAFYTICYTSYSIA